MNEELFTAAFVSGYGPIDEQHRALFEALLLFLAAARSDDRLGAAAASHALLGATRTHFGWEQAQMAEARYPQARAHGADHEAFLVELEQLASEIARDGVTPRARLWVARFTDWFRFHTRGQDLGLARFLRQRAEEAAAGAAAPAAAPPDTTRAA